MLYLEHILNGKTQTLNNIVSISENKNIIEVTTTTETFKIDTNKVKFTLTVSVNAKDKLMDELNIKLDNLLELQKQNKITDGIGEIEKLKDFVKNYEGVNEEDKKAIVKEMVLTIFEVILKKKIR